MYSRNSLNQEIVMVQILLLSYLRPHLSNLRKNTFFVNIYWIYFQKNRLKKLLHIFFLIIKRTYSVGVPLAPLNPALDTEKRMALPRRCTSTLCQKKSQVSIDFPECSCFGRRSRGTKNRKRHMFQLEIAGERTHFDGNVPTEKRQLQTIR